MSISSVEKRGHSSGALSIHPYFGKIDPALVEALLKDFSKLNDLVLDPFCGSGTVIHESILSNRSCVGWDSSPLAILITTAKLLGITRTEENQLLEIKKDIDLLIKSKNIRVPDHGEFPLIPRVLHLEKWFNKNAIRELKFIKWWIDKNLSSYSQVIRTLVQLSFSRIITRSSNQQGESNYRSIDKPDIPGRVLDLFSSSIIETIKYCKSYNREKENVEYISERTLVLSERGSSICYKEKINVLLKNWDSRNIESALQATDKPGLVITSPPYLMSWDYGLYHKFRFYLLGFNLDLYEETEIGRHLRRKNDDIPRYTSDMKNVFMTLNSAMGLNATICMINSPSSVYGKYVDTNEILINCAALGGWKIKEVVPSIKLTGPHHGMHASTKARGAAVTGQAGKKEHVLIFQRATS